MPDIERDPEPQWACPDCGERHWSHDAECTGECCAPLVHVDHVLNDDDRRRRREWFGDDRA